MEIFYQYEQSIFINLHKPLGNGWIGWHQVQNHLTLQTYLDIWDPCKMVTFLDKRYYLNNQKLSLLKPQWFQHQVFFFSKPLMPPKESWWKFQMFLVSPLQMIRSFEPSSALIHLKTVKCDYISRPNIQRGISNNDVIFLI